MNYFVQAKRAALWFVEQLDDHTYLCCSRLGGVMVDSCDCAVMPS